MFHRLLRVTFALALLAPIPSASAQYSNRSGTQGTNQQRSQAGVFDYYLLAMSWSPTFCAENGHRGGNEDQCAPRARPYAFVLHGLWPQHNRGWPEDCASSDRGFVPRPVARRMLDIMPSERLVFHEYRKHGTCSGLGVDGYFDLARQLFQKVRIPQRYVNVEDNRLFVGVNEVVADFVRENPGLKPDMVVVSCGGPGNRLKEVRVCFDKGGDFRACGHNETQRRLCAADRMFVPPVRQGGVSQPPRSRPEDKGPPLEIAPGPRERRL
jgi:ribonuclease T2